ncbi:MAG: serine--tRNA ligase, partial [Thaumarchaeota archaeon]|nr:serine--tRNA ligase [Nitrososphaerota archaeon]
MTDFPLDELLMLERRRRELIAGNQKLKEERNKISVEISKAKASGTDAAHLIFAMKAKADEIASNDKQTQEANMKFELLLSSLPNFISDSVPLGKDETASLEVRKWGKTKPGSLDHIDIAEIFDLIDVERAAKISGARFYFLRRDLVRLNYALISFALEHLRDRGFILVQPPFMLKKEAIGGAVILSDFEDVIYKIENEDLYLIGTCEHA